ncbi:MAG: hypothetical protein WCC30_06495 [Candidatus Dormiibacterota bacterium]
MEPTKNRVGGRNSCSICNHPERRDIDQQIAARIPLRKLAKRYGMSITALSNHNNRHVSKTEFATIKRARAGISKASPQSALTRIEDGLVALEELMANSAKNKESAQWLNAYRERVRTLELVGKARGEFSDAPQVTINVWQTEDWGRIRATIFEVLAEYPAIRAELAKRLMALGEGTPNGHEDSKTLRGGDSQS